MKPNSPAPSRRASTQREGELRKKGPPAHRKSALKRHAGRGPVKTAPRAIPNGRLGTRGPEAPLRQRGNVVPVPMFSSYSSVMVKDRSSRAPGARIVMFSLCSSTSSSVV